MSTATSAIKYNVVYDDGEASSVTAFIDGEPYVALPDHPNFKLIVSTLEDPSATDDQVIEAFDVGRAISRKFTRLSERVTINSGAIFLDGVRIESALGTTILAFHADGQEDFQPLVNFLEKIEQNPNPHSREHAFRWLGKHKFSICPDGDIIAYKGVERLSNGKLVSRSHGTAMCNGEVITGAIPNDPGCIVEMPRDEVQFDPGVGCSTGLHVGNWRYASSFARGAVLRIKVNPRDIVSVPTDSYDEKMRVCRYLSLNEVQAEDRSMLYVDEVMGTIANRSRDRVLKQAKVRKSASRKPSVVSRASKKVSTTAKAAARGAKSVVRAQPKYYEDFTKANFAKVDYSVLRWLAKEWGVKVSDRTTPGYVTALAKAASVRRRELKNRKMKKNQRTAR